MVIGAAGMSEIALWFLSKRGLRHAVALSKSLKIFCFIPKGVHMEKSIPHISFTRLAPAVAEAFHTYPAHIFIMATGIVVRIIAPLLKSKMEDPAVVVMDEQARNVVSLLSGHLGGANALAETVAALTGANPVITTATDVAGLTSFDSLARQFGAKVEPKEAIKATATALLNRQLVALVCSDDLYRAIRGSFPSLTHYGRVDVEALKNFDACCMITDTEITLPPEISQRTLFLRPPTLVLGIGCNRGTTEGEIQMAVEKTLRKARLSPLSIFRVASVDKKANEAGLKGFAKSLGIPFITFPPQMLNTLSETHDGLSPDSAQAMKHLGVRGVAEPAALLGAGKGSRLIVPKQRIGNVTVAVAQRPFIFPRRKGLLTIVGIGPGHQDYLTSDAKRALQTADTIVGYTRYIQLIEPLLAGKEVIQTGMTREIERVEAALTAAESGKKVALIGTGDAGVYGLAGLAIEHATIRKSPVPIKISPGITAAISAATVVGAPLSNDYITLSLSDLLTPRETVIARIKAAAASGMVTVLYNPKSKKRTQLIALARETFLKYRSPKTPVAIVTHALRDGQTHVLTTLQDFLNEVITMNSVVIIGNEDTLILPTPEGPRMVTRRGYERKR